MASGRSILIVEDERDLAELLSRNLQREGYMCRSVADGAAAMVEAQRDAPDLIILDRMLPGMSGDDVIMQLKRERRTTNIPIIMLTAKAEEADELVGFALGADDYVAKPFSMKLLVARVGAVLRRADSAEDDRHVLVSGPISIDAGRHEAMVQGRPVSMTATEFKLLRTLMAAEGRVLSRSQLIDTVMGTGVAVTDRTIDVHVTALRKKLSDAAAWVQTVRGVGYTIREPG